MIEWNEWVGKSVFIKLKDGQIFSYSKVLAYEEPFMSIKDMFGLPAVFNVSEIVKIKEMDDEKKDK